MTHESAKSVTLASLAATTAVGNLLPQIQLRLTLQRLVMEAGANRDFAPSHHDPIYARERGAPTAFANFEFVAGLFERLLREFGGTASFLEALEFRLLRNATIDVVVTAGGEVTAVENHPRGLVIQIDVWQRVGTLDTASGTARLRADGERP